MNEKNLDNSSVNLMAQQQTLQAQEPQNDNSLSSNDSNEILYFSINQLYK